MSFAENIKKIRHSKGWSQVNLADMLDISQKVIATYETGKRKPTIDKLPDFAKIFDTTIDELIGFKKLKMKSEKSKIHRNSRSVKVQKLFEKISPLQQRAILKQIEALVESEKK